MTASRPSAYADIVPLRMDGHPGVWIEEQAFEDILVGIVREKGDLQVELARQKVATDIAELRAQALEKVAQQSAWRAVWLPVVSFIGGALLTGGAVLGGIYAGQALHAAP